MNKSNVTLISLAVGLALFFGINILASASLRSMRLDLTEEKLYTLSDGAKNIASGIDEPVRLYFYFAEDVAREVAPIKSYGERVRDVLDEFALASDGNLIIEVIDPEPYSEEEDRAKSEGIAGVPGPGGRVFYMGLVGTNSTDDREVIAFLDPEKEAFLEYDVARLIRTLAHPQRKIVGFLSSLPIGGAPANPMAPQATQPWFIVNYVGSLFETRVLQADLTEIPSDIDVLITIHPKAFSNDVLYAIDQFVLAGGRTIFYVDPHCSADLSGQDPSNPLAGMQAPKDSDLERLFNTWGFELVNQKIAADRKNALRQQTMEQGRPVERSLVQYPELRDGFDEEDATTSFIKHMIFATPGILRGLPGAKTTFEPLIETSEDSMELEVSQIQYFPDSAQLLNQFVSGNEKLTIAARIRGEVDTSFPDGKPGAPLEGEEAPAANPAHLSASNGPIQVIVVADVDNLTDPFWVQEQRFGNISLGYRRHSDNGDFLLNSVENMAGGEDLISIRARGKVTRPLTKVDALRQEAELRFLAQKQALESELRDAQQRINELQSEKSPDSALILSPEQATELENFRKAELETKKKLRDVQHALLQDIKGLGTRVKWINIALVPLLVTLLAFALGAMRTRRRTR